MSQTGAFSDLKTLTPGEGLVPYDVNSPLWSDGAAKKRWIALPNDGKHNVPDEEIFFTETGEWQFPAGTVFIKHFELPTDENNPNEITRLETRFLIVMENGGAYGVTYKWNNAGTDAELLTSGASRQLTLHKSDGSRVAQEWLFPSPYPVYDLPYAQCKFRAWC